MLTSDGSSQSSSSPQWSDLPDDLLGMVRLRLASPHDRVRLAAVCKVWRAAMSRLPAPPTVPLLLLSQCEAPTTEQLRGAKRLCGPDDSWDVRVPDKADGKWFVGSHEGGWVAAVDWSSLVIVNLFSDVFFLELEVFPVSSRNLEYINPSRLRKIIFSEDPTSSSCILAAIPHRRSSVAVCKIDGDKSGWTVEKMHGKTIMDIAFCNGELYGLVNPNEDLVKFEIGIKVDGTPIITSNHTMAVERRNRYEAYPDYLVELHGKPAMAIPQCWLSNREPFIKVFTLVDTGNHEGYMYKWAEVISFGDHALFFGLNSSKAVHVTDIHRDVKRNHIYYSTKKEWWPKNELPHDTLYSVITNDDEHMYCREDESVGDGVGRTGYYMVGYNNSLMWLHPPSL
ncbi:hypothetical protein D1007_29312 [Hordeum vulgare]|nr:hypothetical protein D1007_29312 [Hordeum vulgare]KAI5011409.1 hypothetical protein ZWY2020_013546 [Hordeum vulgare]